MNTTNKPSIGDPIPEQYKDKPKTQTSDERHWFTSFQPVEYRGFYIYRTPEYYSLMVIRDNNGREISGLHGQYYGLPTCQKLIDAFIEGQRTNLFRVHNYLETSDESDQTHTEQ